MTDVRSTSLNSSPTRNRTDDLDYRSPTYCDSDIYTNPDLSPRDLNYMSTPLEFFRRRTLRRNTLDRVIDQLTVQRPLTLHLGRFQLNLPRLGRAEARPDTPNVAEINIDELDFVRLNSNDTYTLNGRTIRLLGANFENFENYHLNGSRPPPYNEAMRHKYGPPPEYLSREAINDSNDNENEARSNVEMPPCYEDLASGVDNNANDITVNVIDVSDGNNDNNDNNLFVNTANSVNNDVNQTVDSVNSVNNDDNRMVNSINAINNNDNDSVSPTSNVPESISSVIDNLPAIDSDVNANDTYDNSISVQ